VPRGKAGPEGPAAATGKTAPPTGSPRPGAGAGKSGEARCAATRTKWCRRPACRHAQTDAHLKAVIRRPDHPGARCAVPGASSPHSEKSRRTFRCRSRRDRPPRLLLAPRQGAGVEKCPAFQGPRPALSGAALPLANIFASRRESDRGARIRWVESVGNRIGTAVDDRTRRSTRFGVRRHVCALVSCGAGAEMLLCALHCTPRFDSARSAPIQSGVVPPHSKSPSPGRAGGATGY